MQALAILLAAMQIPVPTGVNDSVLGEPEEFKVEGPARICFRRSAFDLLPEESSYLSYLGIHSGGIAVIGPHGRYEIEEGDTWATPKTRGQRVRGVSTKVFRHRRSDGIAYLVYSPLDSDKGERPLLWVKRARGAANKSDKTILKRLVLAPNGPASCTRKFNSGWNFKGADE